MAWSEPPMGVDETAPLRGENLVLLVPASEAVSMVSARSEKSGAQNGLGICKTWDC